MNNKFLIFLFFLFLIIKIYRIKTAENKAKTPNTLEGIARKIA
jgi:hypothetical protein